MAKFRRPRITALQMWIARAVPQSYRTAGSPNSSIANRTAYAIFNARVRLASSLCNAVPASNGPGLKATLCGVRKIGTTSHFSAASRDRLTECAAVAP